MRYAMFTPVQKAVIGKQEAEVVFQQPNVCHYENKGMCNNLEVSMANWKTLIYENNSNCTPQNLVPYGTNLHMPHRILRWVCCQGCFRTRELIRKLEFLSHSNQFQLKYT